MRVTDMELVSLLFSYTFFSGRYTIQLRLILSSVVPQDSSTYQVYDGSASLSNITIDGAHQIPFQISYVDNSSVVGTLMQDTLTIGDKKIGEWRIADAILGAITDFGHKSFAHAVEQGDREINGVWGVGFQESESDAVGLGYPQYPSILNLMKDSALINTKAYSLWLHDLDAATGSILFGGVDTAKFEGPLVGVPLLPSMGDPPARSFAIPLTKVTITDEANTTLDVSPIQWNVMQGVVALPDSGTTFTILPSEIAQRIFSYVHATEIPQDPWVLVPCNLKRKKVNIDFQFGGWNGPSISVPVHELIGRHHVKHARHHKDHRCSFGIIGLDINLALLGDTFLRSAYLVYDLERKLIAMAQSKNTDDSHIQEIVADTIPGMSTVLDPFPTPTMTQAASITTPTTYISSTGAISVGECVVYTEPSLGTACNGYITQIPAFATTTTTSTTTSATTRQDL